jgi:hypothetical protein
VDTSRISFGEMVAAASGIALFIFMFLPWYGVDVSGFDVSESANAWEAMSFIDILLFLVVIIAVGAALARAAGSMPSDLPAPAGTIVMIAGVVAVILILFRIIDIPAGDVPEVVEDSVDFTRKIGIFLALLAAAGIAFGGYTAANERGAGTGPGGGAAATTATTPPPSTPAGGTPAPPAGGTTPPAGGTSTPPPGGAPPSDPPPA